MKAYDVGVYSRKLIIAERKPKTVCYGFHVVIDADDIFIFPSAILLESVPLHELIPLNKKVERYIDVLLNKKVTINEPVATELTKVVELSVFESVYLKTEVPEMIVHNAISKAEIRTFLLSIWTKQYGFKKSPEYFLILCDNLYVIEAELPIGEYERTQDIY